MSLSVKNIGKSPEFRSVFTNFSWLLVIKVAGYIFPLITIPYLAKVLGAEGLGKIAVAASVNVWILTICNWGFMYSATRDLSRCRTDEKQVSSIFSNVLSCRLTLMMICFVVLLLLIAFIPSFREEKLLFIFTFLSIPGHILFPEWFFQAMEEMKYATLFNFFIKLFFTIAVFIFIQEKEDYILQPLLLSLGFILTGIVSHLYIIKRWNVKFQWIPLKRTFQGIKAGVDVFLSVFMHNLYDSFSQIILGYYCGFKHTGVYDAGTKFYDICTQFFSLLSMAFFPVLSRKIDVHKYYLTMALVLASLVSFFLFLFAPTIIHWFYTEEFSGAISVLRILSLSLPFAIMINIYGTNYLLIIGQEKKMRSIIVWVSLLGFVLSFPLVIYYQAIGVAVLLLLVRFVMAIALYVASKKIPKSETLND